MSPATSRFVATSLEARAIGRTGSAQVARIAAWTPRFGLPGHRIGGVGFRFRTVRCPFLEGESAFPGSRILKESHVQIAVRDTACILGVFRPNYP